MSIKGKVVVVTLVVAVFVAGFGLFIFGFLRERPPAVVVATGDGDAELVLQTVGSLGYGTHADWVSYLVQDQDGSWEQSTIWELPADSTIHVTLYQYDSQTGLRNPFYGAPQGLVEDMRVDGEPVGVLDPDEAAHTFAIPDLGVSVPLKGIAGNASNPCQTAPCDTSSSHVKIEFTFRTGKPGTYRWQCFVPCAAGFLNGNGGPMQTIGFMDGWIEVV